MFWGRTEYTSALQLSKAYIAHSSCGSKTQNKTDSIHRVKSKPSQSSSRWILSTSTFPGYFIFYLSLFLPLRSHVSRRELPDSSQIKFLYFIENNAIRSRCSNALFHSIYFWVSILFLRKTFWDFTLTVMHTENVPWE